MIEEFPIINREQWLALRKDDVTASVAACLLGDGVHPYMTALKLWGLKGGKIADDDSDSPAKRRGRLLEPVAIQMLREDRPEWNVERGVSYFRDDQARIGATPDAYAFQDSRKGVVQIKTVGKHAFKGWKDENGVVEIPLWIAVQATVEAAMCGADWAAVAAMSLGDGGLDMHIEEIPIKSGIMTKLKVAVKDFWRRVEESDPYPPDWKKDAATVLDLYRDKDGEIIDFTDRGSEKEQLIALVDERGTFKNIEAIGAQAAKDRKIVDAKIVAMLGNASGARIGHTLVTAKQIKRGAYAVAAGQYTKVSVQ